MRCTVLSRLLRRGQRPQIAKKSPERQPLSGVTGGVLAASMQLLRVRSITAVPPPCLRPLRS
eukprot:COSAG01_NODE_2663_length_7293_cov_5.946483_4_plen_62_part_00